MTRRALASRARRWRAMHWRHGQSTNVRAVLVGCEGEYFSNCPLDQRWLTFTGIDYETFRSFVATGATDEQIAEWIGEHCQETDASRDRPVE